MQDNNQWKNRGKIHNSQENCCNHVSLSQRHRQLSKIQITHIFFHKWNLEKIEKNKNFAKVWGQIF